MTGRLWRVVWTLGLFAACVACDSGKPKTSEADLKTRHVPPPESFTAIEASQTDASELGEREKPLAFTTVSVDEENTPGVLPQLDGPVLRDDPADKSIRRLVYGLILPESVARLHGFRLMGQLPPREVPGYAPMPLRRIRVTLESGPVEAIRFGSDQPPPPPEPPALAGSEDITPTDAFPVDPETGRARLFERDFLLSPDPAKRQFWRFDPPLDVALPFGKGLQLTVEYLDPVLYPTVELIPPGNVQLAIPDRYREQSAPVGVSPLEEKRPTACLESPRGQLACFYTSRAAELYIESPFTEALVGTWSQEGNTLTVELAEHRWTFDVSDRTAPLDFGVYGDGFVWRMEGDDRLHPYHDLAREMAGEKPFKIEDIRAVYHAQADQEGEPETVVELRSGGFAVLQRADRHSPYRFLTRVDAPGAQLQVVTVPMTGRAFIAVKTETEEVWKVYAYNATDRAWSYFVRRKVPWVPWEPEEPLPNKPIKWEQPPDFVPPDAPGQAGSPTPAENPTPPESPALP